MTSIFAELIDPVPTDGPFIIRDTLMGDFEDLRLRGSEGAHNVVLPGVGLWIGDDSDETEVTPERAAEVRAFWSGWVFSNESLTPGYEGTGTSAIERDPDYFNLLLTKNLINTKPEWMETMTLSVAGTGFTYTDDLSGPITPISGTIDTIVLKQGALVNENESFVNEDGVYPVNVQITLSGFSIAVTPDLLDDTDGLFNQLLANSALHSIDTALIPRFAGDGRDWTDGVGVAGNDFITLTRSFDPMGIEDPLWAYAGDFLTALKPGTLNAGDDTIVGTLPGIGTGDPSAIAGANLLEAGIVSGDVMAIAVGSAVEGGNDTLNFTDSPLGAFGVVGDAQTVEGELIGGDDEIVGSGFKDLLFGDAITVVSGAIVSGGDDTIYGIGGDDVIYGDVALFGDALGGEDGDALIVDGNDQIFGGTGDDTIFGGGGDDDLTGGTGKDSLSGGTGDDFFLIGAPGDIRANERYDGGEGFDEILVYGAGETSLTQVDIVHMEGLRFMSTEGSTIELEASEIGPDDLAPDAEITGNETPGTVESLRILMPTATVLDLSGFTFFGWEDGTDQITVYGNDTGVSITGSRVADALLGGNGNDTLSGGAGADQFYSDGGDDRIDGGAQSDTMFFMGSRSDFTISVNVAGAVTVTDISAGSPLGTDTLTGIETLIFGDATVQVADLERPVNTDPTGAVSLSGLAVVGGAVVADAGGVSDANGLGAFSYRWFTDGSVIAGQTGESLAIGASLAGAALAVEVSYTDGIGAEEVVRSADSAPVSAPGLSVTGTDAAEFIGGGANADTLTGLGGDDTLSGRAGNDRVDAGAGDDLAFTGAGDDLLLGGLGLDTLYGAAGNDTLEGGANADLLGAGPGNDFILGGGGADAIWTSRGDDVARGGAGNDTLGGALGDDTLSGEAGEDAVWGAGGNDSLMGGADTDTLGGSFGDDTVHGGGGADEIWGAAGDDSLMGDDGADRIGAGRDDDFVDGGLGADEIFGGVGDDTLRGGGGDDTIYGAVGADDIAGGRGADEIYAGPGADILRFAAGDGADEILFFSFAEDRLVLDAALWTGTRSAAQVVADFGRAAEGAFILDFEGGDSLTFAGRAGVAGLETQIDIV